MNRDRYDLPLTTGSDSAAAFYRDGVDRILSAWYGAGEAFDRAIVEDPAFALAHIARARIHQMNMEVTEARAKAAHARRLAASASERERQNVEIMAAAIEGKPKMALTAAERHLEEFPRDALVLSLLLGAFGPVCILRTHRPRCRKARHLRAQRQALWRGLVVPHLSGLVTYRGRKRSHRPDIVRAGHGAAG